MPNLGSQYVLEKYIFHCKLYQSMTKITFVKFKKNLVQFYSEFFKNQLFFTTLVCLNEDIWIVIGYFYVANQ